MLDQVDKLVEKFDNSAVQNQSRPTYVAETEPSDPESSDSSSSSSDEVKSRDDQKGIKLSLFLICRNNLFFKNF
jgi:hypothetical protein